MNKLRKYLLLSRKQRISIWIMTLLFIKALFLVYFVPLKKYKGRFAAIQENDNSQMHQYCFELSLIRKIGRVLPFNMSCLVESIVIQDYFKRYDLDIQIYLGVHKTDKLLAHAWCLENIENNFKFRIST